MDKEQMATIRVIADGMKVLDQAKSDYKCLFGGAFDEYSERCGGALTKKEIKEVCKAICEAETNEVATSHRAIADALDSIGAPRAEKET